MLNTMNQIVPGSIADALEVELVNEPKLCGTCKHIDYSKTTASELWVECKLTGKRTALFTATCEKWERKERK